MTSDCPRIRELLDSFRCGELLVETNHEVLAHLRGCGACAAELERRERVVALLRASPDMAADAEALTARVRADLQRHGAASPRPRWKWVAGLAASVLVAIAVMRFATGARVDAAAYRDSVGNHVECALSIPPSAAYDRERVARRLPSEFSALAERFLAGGGAYQLVDAHACPYRSRKYVHFVFRRGGRVESLFVDDHPQGELPAAHVAPLKAIDADVYRVDEPPFRVAAAAAQQHQLFFVSDLSDALADDSDAVLARSIAFLRGLR